jgi:phenylacetate-CoA ligase
VRETDSSRRVPSSLLHGALSRWLLLPSLDVWHWIHPMTRPATAAYLAGRRFRATSMSWSEEQKRAWILERLRAMARSAARRTIYYREAFRAIGFDPESDFDFDDFARLPALERHTMNDRAPDLRATDVPASQLRSDATGGTSGQPTRYVTGPEERGWALSAIDHFMHQVGAPRGSRRALFWAHHLDPVQRETLRERAQDWLENMAWFDCMRLGPDDLLRIHRHMSRYRPDVVISYAGALAALADLLTARGERPPYPRRCIITGAEKLWPGQRKRVEEVFGRPVHERYGARDTGLIGFQLTPHRTFDFTVDWCNVLVEPATDSPDAPILVTKLHADAQPMIRYRLGDRGLFPDGSRSGAPAFRLVEVLGREADRIWKPGGGWMLGLGVVHMMKDLPVREFQLYQFADYRVELRVVPSAGFSRQHQESAESILRANLGAVPVSVLIVDQIPRHAGNKLRPVISEVVASSTEMHTGVR